MENKILELLLDMQKDIKNIQSDISSTNNKLDKIEFKVNDGFETLELMSENNSIDIVKVKVSKLEKRIKEMNVIG